MRFRYFSGMNDCFIMKSQLNNSHIKTCAKKIDEIEYERYMKVIFSWHLVRWCNNEFLF